MDLNSLLTDDEFRRFVIYKIAMEIEIIDINILVEYHNKINYHSHTSIGYIHTDIDKYGYYRCNDTTGEREYIDDDYIRNNFSIFSFIELGLSNYRPFKLFLLRYKKEYEGART